METDIRLSLSLSVAAVIVRFTYLTITREEGGNKEGGSQTGERTGHELAPCGHAMPL